MADDVAYPRFASRGRTYVYVLPCQGEELLKVGFSRDPVERLRTLHPRFFTLFDLDRGLLIETDHLRDARRIERLFITTFREHQAPAPLLVPRAAAGHTEWYRGIRAEVTALAHRICEDEGFTLHAPLRRWLHDRLDAWSDRLYDGSTRMLDMIEYERLHLPPEVPASERRCAKALALLLDTYAAVGIDLEPRLPAAVFAWYRDRSR